MFYCSSRSSQHFTHHPCMTANNLTLFFFPLDYPLEMLMMRVYLLIYLFFVQSHPPVSASVMKLLNQPMFDAHPPSKHIALHMPAVGLG